MEEDGTEPRPGIIAGQGRRKTAKTGEDGGGWYITQTWYHSWTIKKTKRKGNLNDCMCGMQAIKLVGFILVLKGNIS